MEKKQKIAFTHAVIVSLIYIEEDFKFAVLQCKFRYIGRGHGLRLNKFIDVKPQDMKIFMRLFFSALYLTTIENPCMTS
ncbi:CLUMA_CG010470, isoform A [Clunio marinus]|uniref:CLUMA_CG010470, isoform A n=1 Tax=Clunio marinus TaxID=568069 RepID=A0A1J1IDK5_9DIPT|nr:CLUMA_CG010470, isoform A [Clunio marinus]